MGLYEDNKEQIDLTLVYWFLLGVIAFYIDTVIFHETNFIWFFIAIITGPLYILIGLPVKYGGPYMIQLMIFATIIGFVIWMALQL